MEKREYTVKLLRKAALTSDDFTTLPLVATPILIEMQ